MKKGSFHAVVRPQQDEQQHGIFAQIAEAIGAGVEQTIHEVIPDIRAKLIDEAWFGQTVSSRAAADKPDIWRAQPMQIEGEWRALDNDPDLTQER